MNLSKPFSRLFTAALAAIVLGMSAALAFGASGTWTNLAGGSWTNSANWSGGTIASGSGSTANFGMLSLTAAPTVTLDGAQTIGGLLFNDVGNSYGWTLNTGSNGPLTLTPGTGSPVITVSNQTSTIGVVLAGSAGLIKQGAGTLVLTNANTYTGTTTISNGVVTYSGSGSYGGGSSANLAVGGAGGRGVFNMNSTGTVIFTSGTSYLGGTGVSTDTGAGVVNQTTGTVDLVAATSVYLTFGAGSSAAYGAYNLSGGALNISSPAGIRIGYGGLGSYVQSGGTMSCPRYFVVGANNTAAGSVNNGVASFLGGSATVSSSFYIIVGNLSGATGTLNLGTETGGTAMLTSGATTGPQIGQVSGASGTLNLNSGTLTISGPIATASGGTGVVNLNGGTVQAGANNVTLINSTPGSVNVYNGGIIVNDPAAFTNLISARLLATTGNGIYPSGGSLAISSGGGSGYLGAPLVTVIGGAGSGATAIATVSGGVVTGVTLTCPGKNYLAGDYLSFAFAGGGATTTASTFSHTLTAGDLAANSSGGLTKLGAGQLTLSAANTYSGGTLVNAGTLNVTADGGLGLGNVAVANGAVLALSGGVTNGYLNASASLMVNTGAVVCLNYAGSNTIFALSTNGGIAFVLPGTYGSAASVASNTLANFTGPGVLNVLSATGFSVIALSSANPSAFQQSVTFTGTVTGNHGTPTGTLTFLDGTNALAAVSLNGSGAASFTTSSLVPGSHSITAAYGGNGSYPPLTSAMLTQVVNGGTYLWSGAVNGAWDINTSANWTVLGNPVTYQDGSSVQLDDSASGTTAVMLSAAVSPSSLVISNNSKSYSFGGSGVLAGVGGLTKLGTGMVTLGTSNTYTGTTLVGAGVLAYSGRGAYSGGSSANLLVGGAAGVGVFNMNSTGTVSFVSGTPYVGGTGGSSDTGAGAINQTAGTLDLVAASDNYLTLGAGSSTAYGSYDLSGGALNISSTSGIRIGYGGLGSYVQTGGSMNCPRYFVVGANNAAAGSLNTGVASFLGGFATVSSSYYIIIGNRSGATGTLNLGTETGGSAAITCGGTTGPQVGQVSGATGTLNLNCGTLIISGPIATASGGTGIVNLNGGTLQGGANNTALINSTPTSVNVYNGGVTINEPAAFTNTIAASLLATTGNGIYPSGGSLAISSGGGGGYIGAPLVAITGGSGSGASAIATVSGGVVTNVFMTCPGQNYAAADVLTFSFSGGGPATPAPAYVHTLQPGDLVANGAGGLTLVGSGILTLSASNTFSGPTVVSNGTLYVNGALNSASAVFVGSGGVLGGTGSVGSVTVNSGGGLEGGQAGAGALTMAQLTFLADGMINLTPGTNTVPLTVTASDGLTVGNEADSISINLGGSSLAPGTYHLIGYSGDLKGVGLVAFQLGSTPSGAYSLVSNPGYVDLVASAYPTITSEPASVSVAADGSATFTVSAADPGALTYQWQLNGVALAGETNASLTLSLVTAANQGVYTVLVSDGTNTAVSAGAVLTVTYPTVTGQWDFKYGDLQATVGSDLQYLGDTTNLTSFTNLSINGQPAGVMAFGAYSTNEGLFMLNGALPNGPAGSQFINQYTVIMDLMYPSASSGSLRALVQTDPFSHAGNDAEFYVGGSSSVPSPNGVGISGGLYNGTIAPNTWYRVTFVVDLTAAAGQQLTTFVNGALVGSQALPGGVDGAYALGPAVQLFTTGLSGGFTQPGYLSSLQFVNAAMSAGAIAALGGPSAGKLPPGNAVPQLAIARSGAAGLQLGWAGPAGNFLVQSASNLANPNWQTFASSTTNSGLTLTSGSAAGFYRLSETIPDLQVGQLPADNEEVVPTKQIMESAGRQIQFSGRPVDLVLSLDGSTAYIKDENTLVVADVATWTVLQTLDYPSSGASLHGIAVSPSGSDVYVTSAANQIFDWTVGVNRTLTYSRAITLTSGTSEPCGIAISAAGTTAYVCLNLANSLAVVNLSSGTVSQTITVGVAPWDVKLSPDGATAYVSDWGGRVPVKGDLTATSDGTSVVVDSRGIASTGEVSWVNLAGGVQSGVVATGLHPTCLALSADGGTLYVANANSDTVTVLNTQSQTVKETILVRPDATMPFGTEPSGLVLSPNGTNLYVACANNNGIAVVALATAQQTNSVVTGFIPTDWYPGAVQADGNYLYAVNVKGLGARYGQPQSKWQIFLPLGTANKIPLPFADALSKYTARVYQNGRVPQILETQQPAQAGAAPVPVPRHVGEPSVFQHVLYIIKENKTYDEMFGDLAQGNGDSNLVIYPQSVSPNHHALASQFVLLDNYYCNGVNSADGHCWCDEGNCADQYEKSFGGFNRSYGMGTDPLVYSASGFIWDNVLVHGLTFRNFGEFYYSLSAPYSWLQYYQDYTNGNHALRGWPMTCGVTKLAGYTSTNVPGSNLNIPDVVRAYGFIQELNAAQTTGVWPAFTILYLCDDHTGGVPSAQAQVADNDLALGQVIQAVSHSRFWTNTVIFVIEDDPQSGYDHVDGHRSLCLVVSPYTKRNQVVSSFYNQCGLVHTMEQILGLPPMNQQDAMAPLMFDCFINVPNFAPYTCLANVVPLSTGVNGTTSLSPKAQYYSKLVRKWGDIRVDQVDDNIFNRYIWHSIKGDAPYPAKFVGAHGKGLKKLGLVLDKSAKADDD